MEVESVMARVTRPDPRRVQAPSREFETQVGETTAAGMCSALDETDHDGDEDDGERQQRAARTVGDEEDAGEHRQPERDSPALCGGHHTTMPESARVDRPGRPSGP